MSCIDTDAHVHILFSSNSRCDITGNMATNINFFSILQLFCLLIVPERKKKPHTLCYSKLFTHFQQSNNQLKVKGLLRLFLSRGQQLASSDMTPTATICRAPKAKVRQLWSVWLICIVRFRLIGRINKLK